MDLRWQVATRDADICDVPTRYVLPWFEVEGRIVPGEPEDSAIWRRLDTRGDGQMPPMATYFRDPQGAVVRDWIEALDTCPQ